MATADTIFDVLRIKVAPINDDEVLASASDIQFSFVQESQIAGSQILCCIRLCPHPRVEYFTVLIIEPIVPACFCRRVHPDFPNIPVGTWTERVWVDNANSSSLFLQWPAGEAGKSRFFMKLAIRDNDAVFGKCGLIEQLKFRAPAERNAQGMLSKPISCKK